MKLKYWLPAMAALAFGVAHGDTKTVTIHLVDTAGKQQAAGQITISETDHGLLFTPQLNSLPAGVHGFHVHQNPSCDPADKDGKTIAAGAAGGHFDPDNTGKHEGPYGNGHLGDLPALYVNADGKADYPVLAPRLSKLSDIQGRALMVHAGGDNHADHPAPLGGGGDRMACGVI